jgi:hypothetical protein
MIIFRFRWAEASCRHVDIPDRGPLPLVLNPCALRAQGTSPSMDESVDPPGNRAAPLVVMRADWQNPGGMWRQVGYAGARPAGTVGT